VKSEKWKIEDGRWKMLMLKEDGRKDYLIVNNSMK
jgi:hypothetical protein